ncbi:MAG TPA: TIGR00266 family protein, partial [Acidimicrobiales bacterium]|nr:TIGR00266 family protein [Acidimicrobiales bacterium]
MQVEIKYDPAFAIAFVTLGQGEAIRAEAGAMVSHTPGLQMQTSTQGGIMKGLKRAVGGESFFMNTFTATQPGDQIGLAAPLPGDIAHWPLSGQTVYLQSGAYLASAMGVEVDSSWGGSKTFFSGEGLIVLKVWGTGDLLVSSYGAIHAIDLAPGQSYVVDTGHMVGWSEGVTYQVSKAGGGWKQTLLGGEGLVCTLTGPGRIYLQTRSTTDFLNWLIPKLPTSS